MQEPGNKKEGKMIQQKIQPILKPIERKSQMSQADVKIDDWVATFWLISNGFGLHFFSSHFKMTRATTMIIKSCWQKCH